MKHTLYSCLVCGHEFRGASDLRRHQNAITLLHRASLTKTSKYNNKCNRCIWYFRSKENLQQHLDLNLDICVDNTRSLSPRTIRMHNVIEDEDENIKSDNVIKKDTVNIDLSISTSTSTRRRVSQSDKINSISTTINSCESKNSSINNNNNNTVIVTGTRQSPRYNNIDNNSILISSIKPEEISNAIDNKRSIESSSSVITTKSKKTKVLIPKDRRAFFAVVSLLIDQTLVPPGVMIDGINFESFIPSDKLPIIQTLKSILKYEC